MLDPMSLLGLAAAALTSLSYVPQVRKALPRGSTDDLSLKMLLALFAGLALWIAYGAVIGDFIIIVANAIGGSLVGTVLACKIRDTAAR
jgi:MtN3 and saliva related transmembrane protein